MENKKQKAGIEKAYSKSSLRYQVTVTSKHRSCPLVPANGISRSAGQLKITNLFSKLRGKICFKYSRFEEKDSNIRILFGLQNSRIRIRIFEIRGKRFESESNPNIFVHLCCGSLGADIPVEGAAADTHIGSSNNQNILFLRQKCPSVKCQASDNAY